MLEAPRENPAVRGLQKQLKYDMQVFKPNLKIRTFKSYGSLALGTERVEGMSSFGLS
jgi:hypothetical protein